MSALALAAGQLLPALHRLGEAHILAHHLQHLLLLAAGALLASTAPARWQLRGAAYPAALAGLALVVAWHLPPLFDAAVTNDPLHLLLHASFLLAGALLGLSAGGIGVVGRGLLLVFLVAAMPLWSFASLAGLYRAYPAGQQALAGTVMFVIDAGIWVAYVWWPSLRTLLRDWRLTAAVGIGAAVAGALSLR